MNDELAEIMQCINRAMSATLHRTKSDDLCTCYIGTRCHNGELHYDCNNCLIGYKYDDSYAYLITTIRIKP